MICSRRSLRGTLLVLSSVTLGLPRGADSQQLKFDHLAVENGLSHTWVRAILKDSRGFLWIGTMNGLNRYDGNSVVVYRHRPGDRGSLCGPQATALLEDGKKRLWVGAGGLCSYRRETDTFESHRLVSGADALPELVVRSLREDGEGRLWVATEAGLFRFDPETKASTRFLHDPNDPTSLSHDAVIDLLIDGRGRLWIATRGGLDRYDAPSGRFVHPLRSGADPPRLARANFEAIHGDENGTLWLATIDDGLVRFHPETGMTKQYLPRPGDPKSIGAKRILSIAGDGKGTLFVGTENHGLNVLDTRSELFIRHLPNAEDPGALSSPSVYELNLDDQGILWIGTFSGGMDYVTPRGQRFGLIKAKAGGLSGAHVGAVIEDRLGDLWIGTDGDGLNRLERKTGRFTVYRHDPARPKTLASDAVLALHEDGQQNLWVGTWAGGLDRLDPRTGEFTHHRRPLEDPNVMTDAIWSIVEDGRGNLLLGSFEAGAQLFDPKTKRFTAFAQVYPGLDPRSSIYAIAMDSRGNVWLAGSGGPEHVDRKTGKVSRYSLPLGTPNDILVDSRGNVWVGTDTGGLYCLEGQDRKIRHYGEMDGLPSDSIANILEDETGSLWLGTGRGLVKFEGGVRVPERPEFLNFDIRDGLQGAEFRHGASFRSASGEMFLGGQRGLNFFFPKDVQRNPHVPPVVLTDLKIFNRPVGIGAPGSPLTTAITEARALILSHKHSVVTFEFSALDFVLPSKNQYRFKLEGFDADWNRVGSRRTATYTNLPPGSYTFRVAGSNNDGVWNEDGVSLALHVKPPFWRTGLFRAALALALMGLAVGIHRYRIRNHLRAERELQTRVREAVAQIRTLSGLLPICAWCKKVRDDTGYWKQLETYVKDHSQADFSHGICPECHKKVRGESAVRPQA